MSMQIPTPRADFIASRYVKNEIRYRAPMLMGPLSGGKFSGVLGGFLGKNLVGIIMLISKSKIQ